MYQQKKPDAKTVTYVLDKNGNRTRLTYPDSYFVDYVFDELNRLTDIKLNGSASAAAHFDPESLKGSLPSIEELESELKTVQLEGGEQTELNG